jgi:heme exporter protein C
VRQATGLRLLGGLAAIAVAAHVVVALAVIGPDASQGDAQRIMYVHVPSAWLAYLAFAVTAAASALFLWPRTRDRRWDLLAGASAEVGVVFTGLTLVTGSLWGRPIWGTWWEWDARLTTTAVLFFLYLGYLAVRRVGGEPAVRGRRSAIVGLLAFADVPIVHFSVNWWETLHQKATVLTPDLKVEMDTSMALVLLGGVVAFTLLYGWLVGARYRLADLDEDREERELERAIAARVAVAEGV